MGRLCQKGIPPRFFVPHDSSKMLLIANNHGYTEVGGGRGVTTAVQKVNNQTGSAGIFGGSYPPSYM